MRYPLRRSSRALAALCCSVLSISLLSAGPGAPEAQAADDPNATALDKDAILAANQLDERQWYKDNKGFALDLALTKDEVEYMQQLHVQSGTQSKILPFEQVVLPDPLKDAIALTRG